MKLTIFAVNKSVLQILYNLMYSCLNVQSGGFEINLFEIRLTYMYIMIPLLDIL